MSDATDPTPDASTTPGERLALSSITFAAGSSPGAGPLTIKVPTITVLVGPNNSGKSAALRELEMVCKSRTAGKVVSGATFEIPDDAAILQSLFDSTFIQSPDNADQRVARRHSLVGDGEGDSAGFRQGDIQKHIDGQAWDEIRQLLFAALTLRLDGEARLGMVGARKAQPIDRPVTSHLEALWRDLPARDRVLDGILRAFGLYLALDDSSRSSLVPYLSSEDLRAVRRDGDVSSYFARATRIDLMGDGVKAYTGLLMAVASLPDRVILIDEPEAFLHPGTSRTLGAELADIARERDGHLVIATHSPEFLMGCVSVEPPAIVRLTYVHGVATARGLPQDDVRKLMRNPRLRSAGAMAALFHRAAVVCEADADRCFYEEVNRRLNDVRRGAEDCLFLNSPNGYDHVPDFVGPLRRLGVPAAALLDLDVLRNEDSFWVKMLNAAAVPAGLRPAVEQQRLKVAGALGPKPTDGSADPMKTGGLAKLPDAERELGLEHLSELRKYGIFLCPVGELECWLGSEHIGKGKGRFLDLALEQFGDDPSSNNYVQPGDDDVWAFLEAVGAWTGDESRLGIPA